MTTSGSYDHIERLVGSSLTGDQESFAELYDLAAPRVLGVVSRVLGPGTRAEEITARVFESVWSHKAEAPEGAGLPWLIDLGRRAAIAQKRSRVPRQRTAAAIPVTAPVESDPAWATALDPEERAALGLVYLEGLTTNEADERLGWLPGTTNLTVRQGMMHLAETENAGEAHSPALATAGVVSA